MRFFFYFLFFSAFLFSCSGNCASCHYKIDYQNDKNHSPMLECKTCHTDEKMAKIDMGTTCGEDCFVCHDAEKLKKKELAPAHKIIESCISCHKNLVKETLKKSIFDQKIMKNHFFQLKK